MDAKHLIGLENLSAGDITEIIDTGFIFRDILERPIKRIPTLTGKNIVNLFFENSTRTKISFELAEKRLSADVTNFSSSSSSEANEGRSVYSASKAALNILSKSIAREMGSSNIRINTVAPGLVDTDMLNSNTPEKFIKEVTNRLSIKRIGKKEEVANTVLFLASDLSSYITGQTIRVDGGM